MHADVLIAEIGSTTTPFDMHVRNNTSRYQLAMAAFEQLGKNGVVPIQEAEHKIAIYQAKIDENTEYIKEHGVDMPEIDSWVWPAARETERAEEEDWRGQTN